MSEIKSAKELLEAYEAGEREFPRANLRGANLGGAYLGDAYLGDANLGDANLGGANLGDANLGDANLRGAYLRDANLGGAYLGDANLGDANLRGANLGGAYLGDAYLGDANLGGAYLGDANLGDANLRGANLGGAYLGDAYLGDANLGGAYLGGAYLPAPQMVLLAGWYHDLSDELTADLMAYDAWSHPDPDRFDEWANGGRCPYTNCVVQRAANFREKKELWGKGNICSPTNLMDRLIAECCVMEEPKAEKTEDDKCN